MRLKAILLTTAVLGAGILTAHAQQTGTGGSAGESGQISAATHCMDQTTHQPRLRTASGASTMGQPSGTTGSASGSAGSSGSSGSGSAGGMSSGGQMSGGSSGTGSGSGSMSSAQNLPPC